MISLKQGDYFTFDRARAETKKLLLKSKNEGHCISMIRHIFDCPDVLQIGWSETVRCMWLRRFGEEKNIFIIVHSNNGNGRVREQSRKAIKGT